MPRCASLALAVVLVLPAAPSRALTPAPRAAHAAIAGNLAVSITGLALKHWGIPAASAAFVPDADHSAYAQRVRAADSADVLCAALASAERGDAAIASAPVDGDGNLEHRSGEQMQLTFRIDVPRLDKAARGVVYLCSSPVVAVIGRGSYPDERFERVAAQRLRWASPPFTVRPDGEAQVHGAASIDASQW